MRLAFVLVLLTIAFSAFSTAQTAETQLEDTQLLDGKLSLLLPKGFEPMGEEMLRTKYPSENRPTLVFTNKRGTVNVAINHTNNRVQLDQVPELYKAMDSTMRNTHPSATWFRSELSNINGRQCFILDLQTAAIDTRVRNIMLGTSLAGRFLIISFNVTRELEAEWLTAGNKIIQSVKVRE